MTRGSGVVVLMVLASLAACSNRIFTPAAPGAAPLGPSAPDLPSNTGHPPMGGMGG